MDRRPVTELSATALAAEIRGGRVSSREVVEEHIALLTAVDPVLNAVVARQGVRAAESAPVVPLGLSADGLPLGVQVAAGHGCDHVTVAVARELERVFGGWVPPAAPVSQPPAPPASEVEHGLVG